MSVTKENSDGLLLMLLNQDSFSPFAERIFRPIRDMFGGRLQYILCGSAPLSPSVRSFLEAVLGVYVIEGYGLTECGIVALTRPWPWFLRRLGAPVPDGLRFRRCSALDHGTDRMGGLACARRFTVAPAGRGYRDRSAVYMFHFLSNVLS